MGRGPRFFASLLLAAAAVLCIVPADTDTARVWPGQTHAWGYRGGLSQPWARAWLEDWNALPDVAVKIAGLVFLAMAVERWDRRPK